ncbi:MAG: hypothetical protein KAW09_03320 [Thermoplasmata archaeon]|nr:hypothetical protein [Thermoplasmata archaeon]
MARIGKKKDTAETAEMGECPTCGSTIPLDADECPDCGEVFALEDMEVRPGEAIVEKGGRKEKILFYLGVILILVGGPGVALGSWMHDWFRIPFPSSEYDAFDVFGPINRIVALVGLVILIIGIVFLILSLRASKVVTDEDYEVSIERTEL